MAHANLVTKKYKSYTYKKTRTSSQVSKQCGLKFFEFLSQRVTLNKHGATIDATKTIEGENTEATKEIGNRVHGDHRGYKSHGGHKPNRNHRSSSHRCQGAQRPSGNTGQSSLSRDPKHSSLSKHVCHHGQASQAQLVIHS